MNYKILFTKFVTAISLVCFIYIASGDRDIFVKILGREHNCEIIIPISYKDYSCSPIYDDWTTYAGIFLAIMAPAIYQMVKEKNTE